MTKLEVGYLVWGVFALCVLIPECLAYFGKPFDGDEMLQAIRRATTDSV